MPHTLKIDAQLLAAIDDLSLAAKTVVEGFLEGLHRSPFLGYSTEFSAYRAYTSGDDIRHIDWNVWARSDKYYVKQFEDNTNLRCQIFLDTSASMDFGEGAHNKFQYGRMLAAVLAYLMLHQRDAPGLVLFGDEVRHAIPSRTTPDQADEIFRLLSQLEARGKTVIDHRLFQIVETFGRRGLAVVISDFFASGDTGLELLRQLHAQRQEILVFQLLAPEELDLPYEGNMLLVDSETGDELPVHAEDYKQEYQRRLEEFCGQLEQECRKLEVDYRRLRTDAPLDVALIAYLEQRAAV